MELRREPIVRIVRNRHGSAKAALAAWREGSLWGAPISWGADKFHVYGVHRSKNRTRWSRVLVEFLADRIIVVKPKEQKT